jgi:hypothetical protein
MDFGATYEQPEVVLAINGNRYRCLGELNTGKKNMVRAAGLEPAYLFRAEGFSYHYGFRRLALGAFAHPARLWSGLYLRHSAFAL